MQVLDLIQGQSSVFCKEIFEVTWLGCSPSTINSKLKPTKMHTLDYKNIQQGLFDIWGLCLGVWCGYGVVKDDFLAFSPFASGKNINQHSLVNKESHSMLHSSLFILTPLTWKGITNSSFSWYPRAPSRDISYVVYVDQEGCNSDAKKLCKI